MHFKMHQIRRKELKYEVVIGLEVHVELKTRSKIFCGCTTKFGGEPNTHCCPVCTGMPGVLPVLNKKAVEYTIAAGLATDCLITKHSVLDRKNYFYPDLPKAYQISQLYKPFCSNGYIEIETPSGKKTIRIREIHLEEDAGKLIHDEYGRGTLVDFNRCGVPLIEIVTMPDLSSSEEAKTFLDTLKTILKYTDVSDCKMQEGSLRADVNLSVMEKGAGELGTRTEMKNLNSFKAIARAIKSETKRQIRIIEDGGNIIQETRRWNDDKGISYSMRSKEEAHDYKYFPEPDLLPIEISDEWLEEIKNGIPELPKQRIERYTNEYMLPNYDAMILTSSKILSDFFEETVTNGADPKIASNWLMGDYMKLHNENDEDEYRFEFKASDLADMIGMIQKGEITGKVAKDIFRKMYMTGKDPKAIMKEDNIEVIVDSDKLTEIVKYVIKNNPKSVEDYKNGKGKAIGFLMGQIMRETKGMADPKKVKELLIINLKV